MSLHEQQAPDISPHSVIHFVQSPVKIVLIDDCL